MRWLVALALIAGCRKEPRPSTSAPPPAPDAGPNACVAQCVHDSQMRATSMEQIERECRDQCAASAAP